MSDADNSLPPSKTTIQRAFEALITTLRERGIRYAIIGGIATIQHTRVRTTDDIDALLILPQLAMPGFFDALRERGFALDTLKCVREFCDHGLTTVQFDEVLVDLMRPILPAYAHVLDRAIAAKVLGQTVQISSAESLIVMKMIAMRPQDETDVQDLLAAYRGDLDLDYVRAELRSVTESNDPRWTKIRDLGWAGEFVRAREF